MHFQLIEEQLRAKNVSEVVTCFNKFIEDRIKNLFLRWSINRFPKPISAAKKAAAEAIEAVEAARGWEGEKGEIN